MTTLDDIYNSLNSIKKQLNQVATAIARNDVGLQPHKNTRRIAQALCKIFEIENQIYKLRPELKPVYPGPNLKQPMRELERVFFEMKAKGDVEGARAAVEQFIESHKDVLPEENRVHMRRIFEKMLARNDDDDDDDDE
jgi:hypothetical protein